MSTPPDLKSLYSATYRIILDESASTLGQTKDERLWLYQIPCKYGHIYPHGSNRLGAYVRGRIMTNKAKDLPGVTVHQDGDGECALTFPIEVFPLVADLLKARKRRIVSEAQRARFAETTARFRFQSSRPTLMVTSHGTND